MDSLERLGIGLLAVGAALAMFLMITLTAHARGGFGGGRSGGFSGGRSSFSSPSRSYSSPSRSSFGGFRSAPSSPPKATTPSRSVQSFGGNRAAPPGQKVTITRPESRPVTPPTTVNHYYGSSGYNSGGGLGWLDYMILWHIMSPRQTVVVASPGVAGQTAVVQSEGSGGGFTWFGWLLLLLAAAGITWVVWYFWLGRKDSWGR